MDRIGYRASMILAHAAAALGLIALTVLPEILPDAYTGLLIAVVLYATGGGLLEVVVSPVDTCIGACRLWNLWFFSRDSLAGNIFHGVKGYAGRGDGSVCDARAWRRSRLLGGTDLCRHFLGSAWRQSGVWNPVCGGISGAAADRAAAVAQNDGKTANKRILPAEEMKVVIKSGIMRVRVR